MRFAPVAPDDLPYRVQRFSAGGPAREFQHQPLGVRSTGHLKSEGPEQTAAGAKFQLPLTAQFMNVKPCTLHVSELAL